MRGIRTCRSLLLLVVAGGGASREIGRFRSLVKEFGVLA